MTFWTLIRRSLRYHARAHFGVVLGAAIGSAALTGALGVGDSVRATLRARALSRLGKTGFALNGGDRFFRRALAENSPTQSAVLALPGTATRQDAGRRVNRVNVLGVDEANWPWFAGWRESRASGLKDSAPPKAKASTIQILPEGAFKAWQAGESALVNENLAHQLNVQEGDEIILRVRKPTALAQDAVISPRNENTLALRLKVGPVLPASALGDFSLSANQGVAANAFLPLDILANKAGLSGRANLLVNAAVPTEQRPGGRGGQAEPLPTQKALDLLTARLDQSFRLEDAQLTLQILASAAAQGDSGAGAGGPAVQLSSARIFLEPQVAAAALHARDSSSQTNAPHDLESSSPLINGEGVLTYLANLLRAGTRATPYSMVCAAGTPLVPPEMRDDEILVNDWLAEDLKVHAGDAVVLSYYLADSASRLVERSNSFRVRGLVPLKGVYADQHLMPEFPGLAKAESTHDWDAGFPLVYPIREKDEAYWKQYRGTPKAFITLKAGQRLWASRFGSLTAIRYYGPTNLPATVLRDEVNRTLRAHLNPAELGLRWEPVREQALRAAEQSQDFGQLFLGFSLFLVVAAVLLMALLFQFGLEQRATEVGTLLALGFRAKQVRVLLLLEGAVLAAIGGVLGAAGGLGYAKAMLWGLSTLWRSAVAGSALEFHVTPASCFMGASASTLVACVTIWLTLRKQARQPPRELLAGEVKHPGIQTARATGKGRAVWLAAGAGGAAVTILGWALWSKKSANAEAFFSGGALLLVAGLATMSWWLNQLGHKENAAELTLTSLGVRGCARRRARSVATIALLASGSFLIASIGVFRLEASRDAAKRSSGTGGFALLGESTMPVVQDLNTSPGRDFFGLGADELAGVTVVAFRVHEGDEASCLNLNHPQRPRLLGVKPELLAGRFTFAREAKSADHQTGWELLRHSAEESGEVAAIGDANSLEWALGKKVGDTLAYTDAQGRTFKLRIVGAVANSILQGSLIIDEKEFLKRFPDQSGYRMFLLDAPSNGLPKISATLSRALQDLGLELTPAVERLEALNAVQNTYLGTFQILGGLGLLLGSAGLGVVVLRNVLERRGELALLMAVGFRKRMLQRLLLAEHGALLALGLGLGLLAAAAAVLPSLLAPGTRVPFGSLSLTLGAVALNAALWTWLATCWALRGNLLAALRNE
jgi:ABC-type antimicrobial peptide transport system permease subunit